MKKILSFIMILAILMSTASISVVGLETADFEVAENGDYENGYPESWVETSNLCYTVENGEATIVYWKGDGISKIPSLLGGYPVVAIADGILNDKVITADIILPDSLKRIGEYAFANCSVQIDERSITTITIGKNIEVIGEGAFTDSNGVYVEVVDDNPHYVTVDNCLYTKDMKTLLMFKGSFQYYEFPENLTRIGAGVFAGRWIGEEIVIPDGVTLGEGVFAETDIEGITLPSDLTEIPPRLFYNCEQLAKVEIPETVTKIGDGAFAETSMIRHITIPDSVTYFGEGVFEGAELQTITFPKGITKISDRMFYHCVYLENMVIPDTVTEIGESAFQYCNFSTITLSKNLKSIGYQAFADCSNLKEIVVPDSVTDIDRWAFLHSRNVVLVCTIQSAAADFAIQNDINFRLTDITTKATSLVLNATTITWAPGKSGYFKPKISPEGALQKLKWTSSNTSVATVDLNGKLTAVSGGNCVITCKTIDGSNLEATCKVNVKKIPVSSVKLNVSSLTWGVGRSGSFKATVSPSDAHNKALTWTSSNTKVATVSSTGKLTAVGVGTATITCKASDGSGKYATCKVTVKNMTANLKLNATTINWPIGKSGSFKPTVSPAKYANQKLSWTSSDPKVATVSSTGKLTAKASGTTTITCKTTDGSNLTATCKVSVSNGATSLKLNCSSIKWIVGKSGSFKPTVLPANADKTLKWTSSNTNVATVDSNGKLTAVGIGTATITCKAVYSNGLSATCKVTVGLPITSINLENTDLMWEVGKSGTIKTNIQPWNAINKSLEWTSSDPTVASVDANGKITALKEGETVITCKTKDGSNISETCMMKVSNSIRYLALNTKFIQWEAGKSGYFKPVIQPANASKENLKWTSVNPNVATVDANGKLTAVAPGTTTIICETTDGNNIRRTCDVFVTKEGECVGYTNFYKTYKLQNARYQISGEYVLTNEDGKTESYDIDIRRYDDKAVISGSKSKDGVLAYRIACSEGLILNVPDIKMVNHITKEEADLLGITNNQYNTYQDYHMVIDDEPYDIMNLINNLAYIKTTTEVVNGIEYSNEHFRTVTGNEVVYSFTYKTTLRSISFFDPETGEEYCIKYSRIRPLDDPNFYSPYTYDITEISKDSIEVDFSKIMK